VGRLGSADLAQPLQDCEPKCSHDSGSLGVFVLALHRYGTALVPTGPRLSLALMLIPATLAFVRADRVLVQGRGVTGRIVLRVPFFLAFTLEMILSPTEFGLVFNVLPVFCNVLAGVWHHGDVDSQ
jgi:hypothetical protein